MRIWVKTPARLHLGQIDLNGDLGRKFGGIGAAIEGAAVELIAHRAEDLRISGVKGELKTTATAWCRQYSQYLRLEGGAHIQVRQTIPPHIGLGSGTQLSLALAFALACLYRKKIPIRELAQVTDRAGSRSGIGAAVFQHGGFVMDGGMKYAGGAAGWDLPPVIFSYPFPEEWHFVVTILPLTPGMHGNAEEEAFRRLPAMDERIVGRNCRLLIMKMLPALVEKNIVAFGEGLSELQRNVGAHFSPVQKGIFAGPLAESVINFMIKEGARGVGQSSWGPTVYGLIERERSAELEQKVRSFLAFTEGCRVFSAGVPNRGAVWARLLQGEKKTDQLLQRSIVPDGELERMCYSHAAGAIELERESGGNII